MSNIKTWTDFKNYCVSLIKTVSDIYGGEDENMLNKYIDDVIKLYKINLKAPVECFEKLIQQAKDCGWIRYDYNALERFTETDRCQALPK